jgi:acetoin utilization protein AcuB
MLLVSHEERLTARDHGSEDLAPSRIPVGRVMTPMPVVATQDMSLDDAQELMLRAGVRHLPITNGDRLVDVVTDRDVANLAAQLAVQPSPWRRSRGPRPGTLCEILTGAVPYVCTPDTPLDVVARCMVATNTDVAVVVNDQLNVVGIFTAVDALRCVSGQLRMR